MKYNVTINETKTEIIKYTKDADLRKVKKLGTILDVVAEFNRCKQLAALAMIIYRKIWRKHYTNIKNKMSIYNVYVRFILLYNCSTWVSNNTIKNKPDSFHRRQLRHCFNVYYPKIIKNDHLYELTKQEKLSEFVAKRRVSHLGHILRRNTPTRDTLHYITTMQPKPKCSKQANLKKTYRDDLGSPDFHNWLTRALARRL